MPPKVLQSTAPPNPPRCDRCDHFLPRSTLGCDRCRERKTCAKCTQTFQHGAWEVCSGCAQEWSVHAREGLAENVFRMDTCGKCHRRDHAGWLRENGVLTCSYCRGEHPPQEY